MKEKPGEKALMGGAYGVRISLFCFLSSVCLCWRFPYCLSHTKCWIPPFWMWITLRYFLSGIFLFVSASPSLSNTQSLFWVFTDQNGGNCLFAHFPKIPKSCFVTIKQTFSCVRSLKSLKGISDVSKSPRSFIGTMQYHSVSTQVFDNVAQIPAPSICCRWLFIDGLAISCVPVLGGGFKNYITTSAHMN